LEYADIVNIYGATVHIVMKNTDALLSDIKESGLEINACKFNYIIINCDPNSGRNRGTKAESSSFVILT
jgi:hypothetical protein